MDKDLFLLSICIPTFNQSEFLDQTLQSIVAQDEFKSGKVQICISDNASTDNTENIIKYYKKRFPDLVKYIIQERNIEDKNFITVLNMGDGRYLKLNNTSLKHEEGSLAYMITEIESHKSEKPLFFFGESSFECHNLDEFMRKLDFWVTWIGLLGLWRKDLEKILNLNSSTRKLWQTDIIMYIVEMYGGAVIKKGNLTRVLYAPKNYKNIGGYDFNEVFINEYLSLISRHLHYSKIKTETFNLLRRNILYKHCAPSAAYAILTFGKNTYLRMHFSYLWRWYHDKPHYLSLYLFIIFVNMFKLTSRKVFIPNIKTL